MTENDSGIEPPERHEADDYILLGEVADRLGRQTQYTSYYLTGVAGYPNLGEGLDYIEDSGGNYHATVIRRSDAEKFISRILSSQQKENQ
ncbi:MAG TPA: hypothetical protein VFW90_01975 [Candidatus Saccharimonadales bacterium]|nr:hypothetical protein [Candidatus Saccharimonadales bacterium]